MEYTFKKLINGKGFYSAISLDTVPSSLPKIELEKSNIPEEWLKTIEFGLDYFSEVYFRENKLGFKIKISQIQTQIVDTTSVVVLYVFLKAISKSVSFNLPGVDINSTGELVLPK